MTLSKQLFYATVSVYIMPVLIVIAVGLMAGAWFQWCNAFNDKPEIWFQRAGSIATMFAIIAEANILNIKRITDPSGWGSEQAEPFIERYSWILPWYEGVLLILLLFSTAVWGYGDLIYLRWGG